MITTRVNAHPSHQDLIPNGDRVHRNGVHWPGVGHLAAAGGGNAENLFGTAFASAGHTWTNALCNADTDTDGFSNGFELGDPSCTWTPGSAPERATDITHPGYLDSVPLVTTPSFRIVGPSAHEGVLQGRVYPKPWGTVNFGGADRVTSALWAHEYCRQASALNKSVRARAFTMAERPAADQQYLPPGQYVSISDVTACNTDGDMLSCSFAYSDVGSPQNTTDAATSAIYIDCRDSEDWGLVQSFYPVRLRGATPGRGTLELFHKSASGHGWVEVRVLAHASIPRERFVCTTLLGYDAAAYTPQLSALPHSLPKAAQITSFDPLISADVAFANSTVSFAPSTEAPAYEYVCAADASTPEENLVGPTLITINATIVIGHTPVTFAALVAASFAGVLAADVGVTAWDDLAPERVSRVAFHVKTSVTGGANPSAVARSVAAVDPGGTFGTVSSLEVPVPDASAPSAVPDFWIDGPDPHRGVLKARYGAGTWGHVAWTAASAVALCSAAGQASPSHVPAATLISADPASAAAYMVAGEYVSVSGGGGCSDASNLATCRWVFSPNPSTPRNVTPASDALWLDCQASSYPLVRLLDDVPGMGLMQARVPGTTNWVTAWSDMSAEKVCQIAGFPPYEPGYAAYFHHSARTVAVTIFLHDCDIADLSSCAVTTHDPPQNYAVKDARCAQSVLADPALLRAGAASTGPYVLAERIGLRSNVTEQHVVDYIAIEKAHLFNVSASDVRVNKFYVNETTELAFFEIWAVNDNPTYPVYSKVHLMTADPRFGIPDTAGTDVRRWKPAEVVPPNPAPATLEMRLNGPTANEGFPEARYGPGRPWGKFDMDGWPGGWWSDRAFAYCKGTGRYDPNYQARYFFRRATGHDNVRWDLVPNYADYLEPAMKSMLLFTCNPHDTADWKSDCRWWHSEKAHASTLDFAPYVRCDERPWKMRLAGAFPGTGVPNALVDGYWNVLRIATTNDAKWVCERAFGYPALASHTPTLATVLPHNSDYQWADCSARLPTPGDNRYWLCPLKMAPANSRRSIDCVPLPSSVAFGGASVTQLNAAIDFNALTPAEFKTRVAAHAGIADVTEVLIHQWYHVAEPGNVTYLTVSINNTGVNTNVALNALAADATLPWVATDVRSMPVPTVGPGSWSWGFEARDPLRPMLVTVVTRPTTHHQNGIPCAAKWSPALSRTFCATVFGAGVLSWPRPPAFVREPLPDNGVRHMVVEDVLCAANSVDIATCSYAYAESPSAQCPGDENIVVDCQPPTRTATFSRPLTATVTVSKTVTTTTTESLPPTGSSSHTATPLPPDVATGTATRSPTTTSSCGTVSASATMSPSASRRATPSPVSTLTRAATRTPDNETPAPPTPVPPPPPPTLTRSLIPPTRTTTLSLPPPPPSLIILLAQTAAAADAAVGVGGAPLRPGESMILSIRVVATRRVRDDGALNFTVALDSPLVFACTSGGGGDAPAQGCAILPDRSTMHCSVPAHDSNSAPTTTRWSGVAAVIVTVPYVPAVHGRGTAFARGEALYTGGSPSSGRLLAATTMPVPLRVAASWPPALMSAVPPLNQISPGDTLTLRGTGLEATPVRLWIGPWHVASTIDDVNGTVATIALPSASFPPPPPLRAEAERGPPVWDCTSTVAAESAEVWNAWRRSFVATGNVTAREVLRAFGFHLRTGVTVVRPPAAAPDDWPPPAPFDPSGPPIVSAVDDAAATVALRVFVPTCGNVSANTTAIAAAGSTPNQSSVRSVALLDQIPVATAHAGPNSSTPHPPPCLGSWVTFAFPRDVVVLATGAAIEVATDSASTMSTDVRVGLTVTVSDPEALTVTSDVRTYSLPALSVRVDVTAASAKHQRYTATLEVSLRLGLSARNVTVLAYPHVGSSSTTDQRQFPVRLSTAAAACSYTAANVSSLCRRPLLRGAAEDSWNITIAVDAPRYYSGRLGARVHVGAIHAVGLAVDLDWSGPFDVRPPTRVAPPSSSDPTIGGPSATNNASWPGATAPPWSTLAAAAAPPAPPVGTPAPPALGAALARGIFGAGPGCSGAAVSFVAATLVVGILLVLGRCGLSALHARRSAWSEDDDDDSSAVTPRIPTSARAVLATHILSGAVWPCRPSCGPVHATMLLVHVFTLYAVAASLVNAHGDLAVSSSVTAFAALGGSAAFVAVAVQAFVAIPFRMHRVVDDRRPVNPVGGCEGYAPSDLTAVQVARPAFVGVSSATTAAATALEFSKHGDHVAMYVDDITAPPALSDGPFCSGEASPNSPLPLGHDHSPTSDGFRPVLPSVSATNPVDVGHGGGSSGGSVSTSAADGTTESVATRANKLTSSRFRNAITIDAAWYGAAGYAAAAALTLALAMYTAVASATWCAAHLATFWGVVVAAVAVDATLGQALYIAGAFTWVWLNLEDDDDDDDDAPASSPSSPPLLPLPRLDAHPRHGERVIVGDLSIVGTAPDE